MVSTFTLITLFLTFATAAPQDCPTASTGELTRTIISDQILREYLLYIPDYVEENPPLIIALHGFGSNMNTFSRLTDWYSIADAHGAVVAIPQGFRARWNASIFNDEEIDDIVFLRDLLTDIQTVTCFEAVYVTGFSNGGGMAERIACEMSADIAAIGIVAGAVNADFALCDAQQPVPLIALYGLQDFVVPYNGLASGLFNLPSVADWLGSWAARNDCADTPTTTQLGEDLQQIRYTDCAADVILYVVESGQHEWFGGVSQRMIQPSETIDATQTIWAFFTDNPPNR